MAPSPLWIRSKILAAVVSHLTGPAKSHSFPDCGNVGSRPTMKGSRSPKSPLPDFLRTGSGSAGVSTGVQILQAERHPASAFGGFTGGAVKINRNWHDSVGHAMPFSVGWKS